MLQADPVQPVQEVLALAGVGLQQVVIVALGKVQTHHRGLLQGGGGAHRQEIVDLLGPLHDLLGSDQVAQPPAGDGVGLGQGIAGDGVLVHPGQRGHADVVVGGIDHVLVDLVGDDKGVVLQGQLADPHQFLPGKDLAAGVGGVADDDPLGPLAEALLHQTQVEVILRRHQGHIDGLGPREDGIGAVVLVEGRKDDDLVPRVADGHDGAHHRLGAAAGDDDFLLGVDLPADGPGLFAGQSLAEILGAEGDGILVGPLVGHPGQGVQNFGRGVKIREPLGEIDGSIFIADPGHPADDRIRKSSNAVAQCRHVVRPP